MSMSKNEVIEMAKERGINLGEPEEDVKRIEGVNESVDVPKTDKFIYQRILTQIHKENLKYIGIMTGDPGKGKSYHVIRMAEQLDPTFNIDRVFFTPLKMIDHIFELYKEGKLKKGMFWVLDEGGVSYGNRTWYQDSNLYMNYMAQTFRKMGQGIFITLPYLDLLDKQARKLRDSFMISKEPGEVYYFKSRMVDKKSGKVIDQAYRYGNTDEKRNPIGIKLPKRIDMDKDYEEKKDYFLYDVLGRNVQQQGKDEQDLLEAIIEKCKEEPEQYISENRISKSILKVEWKLEGTQASYIKDRLQQELDLGSRKNNNSNKTTKHERELIRELYENTDMSQGDIAKKIGRSKSTVNNAIKT